MTDDLTKTRDYVYVICTLIQTLFAVFVWVWWERRNRNQDKKEERRKEEADRQKADTKQIIAILSENYDEVQEIFQVLKKSVTDLKKRQINTGSRTFTEFDVLLYMCHADKWSKFRETPQFPIHAGSREKVMFIVNKIMKFIKNFAIQLAVIDKACPDNIMNCQAAFCTEIIEMGETINPFVTKTRQKLIKSVLIYFGYTKSEQERNTEEGQQVSPGCMQRCYHCCVHEQNETPEGLTSGPEPSNNEDFERTEQSSANEGLILYPGHEAIENAIPYIESFKYENGKMICNLTCTISHIQTLEVFVEEGKIEEAKKVEISETIKTLWQQCRYGSDLAGDLLHLIRMVKFKLLNGPTFSQNHELLHNFVEYVKSIVNSTANLNKDLIIRNCERALQDMEMHMTHLHGALKHLKGDINTQVLLQRHADELGIFMKSKLSTQ
jgi:hypothetical protein